MPAHRSHFYKSLPKETRDGIDAAHIRTLTALEQQFGDAAGPVTFDWFKQWLAGHLRTEHEKRSYNQAAAAHSYGELKAEVDQLRTEMRANRQLSHRGFDASIAAMNAELDEIEGISQ